MPRALALIIFCFFGVLCYSQNLNLKFEHITTKDGLSQSNVMSILHDSRGFMWFGTRDGLNKYDGYKFTVYKSDPADEKTLSHNAVSDVAEDTNGNLWIATYWGINFLDREKDEFTRFVHNEQDPHSIAGNIVNALTIDHDGNLWIGLEKNGLDMYDRKTKRFIHYRTDPGDPATQNDFSIKEIFEDSHHNLWIGTGVNGLKVFDKKAKRFVERFHHDQFDQHSIGFGSVWEILEDRKGRMWIGTREGGLNLYLPDVKGFKRFMHNPSNPHSIAHNVILALTEDNKGNIWVGTENGGLCILDPEKEIFHTYRSVAADNSSLNSNSIYSIYKDVKGNIWIGTFSGGVNFVNRDADKFNHYRSTSSSDGLSHSNVLAFFEDRIGNLWIGTDGGGLNYFDRQTGHFTYYLHDPKNKNSICGNSVLSVIEDHQQNVWVGTWADGVTVFNKNKNTFRHYRSDPYDSTSLSSNNAWIIYQDRDHDVWIGTYSGGVDHYNPKTETFNHYRFNPNDPNSISGNTINYIYEDTRGNLWVGTSGDGLNKFNKRTGKFQRYQQGQSPTCITEDYKGNLYIGTDQGLMYFDFTTEKFTHYRLKDGLPNENIFGILEDDKHNVWISTNKGISKFNPQAKAFTNYAVQDGLQADEFKKGFLKNKSGWMYFGGINGFNEFHPDSIRQLSFSPPLVITDFQIANEKVKIAGKGVDSPLTKNINEVDQLVLSPEHTVFSFEFATLNYTSNDKKQYAYMLEGFDKDWNYVKTKHSATYTNIDPGEYTFMVKSLDNEGNWMKDTAKIKVLITPPYWKTWWFRLSLAFLIIGGVIAVFRIRVNVIQNQKHELERQVLERTRQLAHSTQEERNARREAEKAKQDADKANTAKSIFLATMSHEIRTPMNGVIGMASLLAETTQSPEQKEYTETIRSCGESLLGVINDILDFSKIESGNMELEQKDFDLRTCVEDVLDVFADKASKIGLDLLYEIDHNVPPLIKGDSLRLRQIMINLVSNAIKFTQHGEVFIGVRLVRMEGETLELAFEVCDTGIGIPEDKRSRLFKAFSQVDSSTTRKYGGTGLGLVICEKLIGLMGGAITVDSEEGRGTTFKFNIHSATSLQVSRPTVGYARQALAGRKVLVIDDNPNNLRILKSQLEQWNLTVKLAASAEVAVEAVKNDTNLALVIADMQMPVDGIQLAYQLRQVNNNLPIILISAKGDERLKEQHHLFASVITKPVRQATLKLHVLTQLKQGAAVSTMVTTPRTLTKEFALKFPMNILIAEDNPVNQRLAERVLTKLGYQPEIVFNGQAAIEMLDTKHFDLILMDVQMPVMDGMEATMRIRQRVHQPVIIAMTANAMQGDREKCLEAGMDDYISKPIKIEDLVSLLEKWSSKDKLAMGF